MWRTISENFNFSIIKVNGGLVTVLLGLVVLGIVRTILQYRKNKKLPPGPSGLPILGYYPFLLKNPRKALNDLADKYGSVVGFCIGPQYTVILNDWDAVKDALGKNVTVNRPHSTFETIPFKFGVASESGETWRQTRRLFSKAMKDTGLHSTRWEELVQEEALELANQINQQGQRPFELRSFFAEGFANNIVSLVLGERLPSGHRFTKLVVEAVDLMMESQYMLSMMNFSSTLYRLMQLLRVEPKYPLFEKVVCELCIAVGDTVKEKLKNIKKGSEDSSFIVQFHKEIENHHKSKENVRHITEENMKGSIVALLAGGSDTGRTTTIWALIAMAEHPEIQRRVHEELDKVIGKDGTIQWADRMKIPYTFASLLETMRWKSAVPLTTLRIFTEDTYIQGYHIPKGTYLAANNWRIHSDPKYWPNPEKFIPERFLEDDGKKVNSSMESFNPFSYGKRMCAGKLVALMENLQYLSILMQKFEVLPVDGSKVKHDLILGLTEEATNVYLRFIPR